MHIFFGRTPKTSEADRLITSLDNSKDHRKVANAMQRFIQSKESLSTKKAKDIINKVSDSPVTPSNNSASSSEEKTSNLASLNKKVTSFFSGAKSYLYRQGFHSAPELERMLRKQAITKCEEIIARNALGSSIEDLKNDILANPKNTKELFESFAHKINLIDDQLKPKAIRIALQDIIIHFPRNIYKSVYDEFTKLDDFQRLDQTIKDSLKNLCDAKDLMPEKPFQSKTEILKKVDTNNCLGSSAKDCKAQLEDLDDILLRCTSEVKDRTFQWGQFELLLPKAKALLLKSKSSPDQMIIQEGANVLRSSTLFSDFLVHHIEKNIKKAESSPRPQYFYRKAMEDMKILLEQYPESLLNVSQTQLSNLAKICTHPNIKEHPLAVENLEKIRLGKQGMFLFKTGDIKKINQIAQELFSKESATQSAYIRDKHIAIITVDKTAQTFNISIGRRIGEGTSTEVFLFEDNTVKKVTKTTLGLLENLRAVENEQNIMTELHNGGNCVGIEPKCKLSKMDNIYKVDQNNNVDSYQERLVDSDENPPEISLLHGPVYDDLTKIRTSNENININEVLSQISSGIDSMHRLGIVHGDINPGNILYKEKELEGSRKPFSKPPIKAVLTDLKGAAKIDPESKDPLSKFNTTACYVKAKEYTACVLSQELVKKIPCINWENPNLELFSEEEQNMLINLERKLPDLNDPIEINANLLKLLKTYHLEARQKIDVFQLGVVAYQLAVDTSIPLSDDEVKKLTVNTKPPNIPIEERREIAKKIRALPCKLDAEGYASTLKGADVLKTLKDVYGKEKAFFILRMLSDNPEKRPTAAEVKATFASIS